MMDKPFLPLLPFLLHPWEPAKSGDPNRDVRGYGTAGEVQILVVAN